MGGRELLSQLPKWLSISVLSLLGCATEHSDTPVEIADLLAHPAKFTGHTVRVRGAAVVRFEANFICPTPALIDSRNSKRCLWMSSGQIGESEYPIQPFHKKNVEIVGRFDPTLHGHFSAYGATIFVRWGKVLSAHGLGDIPPPPPRPSPSP